MPFVCSLDPSVPLDADFIGKGNETIVRLAVGYDDVSDDTISLAVALSPNPGGSFELTFSIVRYRAETDSLDEFWDGAATKPLIPDLNHRSLIMAALMACIAELIEQTAPASVCMTTHTPHLPDKALAKFWEINEIFKDKGYEAGAADPYHGRHIWMMSRNSPI